MAEKYTKFLQFILFFVFLSFIPTTIYAQCAGGDGNFTVCDIPNPSSQTIDLFSKLTGSPLSGGVWTDDNGSGGLNSLTGVLNVQQIRQSSTFHYTYTVEGIGLCPDNSATVAVTVGGYSGVSSNVVLCSSIGNYNLFQSFNGLFLGPQSNGQWHNDTTNQNVGSIINVDGLDGNYPFTYTMPAIGTCPAMSSTAVITVFREPKSGTSSRLLLCATDGLSAYTNVDLNTLLSGQDANGTWTDDSGTGELTFAGDHFVNAQRIYTRLGLGVFRFTYTVLSTKNSICPNALTTVEIRIEEKLDFTGAKIKLNSNICETEISTATYSATITKETAIIPDGSYYVSFNVSGPNGATETVQASFVNGILNFPIDSNYFQQIGNYTVSIRNLVAVNSAAACKNIFNLSAILSVFPIPDLIGAKITPIAACQNTSALVTISDATRVVDGTYEILYTISGANTAPSQIAIVTFTGGIATFTMPAILNSQSGNGLITITNIKHSETNCTNSANIKGDIVVNPLPNAANLRIQVGNVCFGSPVTASVSGLGTLTNVTLSYTLSGANTATVQTVALTSSNGSASFPIPSSLLVNTGSTTITVTNLKNNSTNCDSNVSGLSYAFSLNPIPVAPTAIDQSFCKSDSATVARLIPGETQFKWYISATSTTPLASTYVLKSEDYYLRETALTCVSDPTKITVTINDTPAPELNTDGQNFCGLDAPTILDLSNKTNVPSSVVWYDAPANGSLLPSSTALVDKKKYYGFDISTANNCLSYDNLEVTVSLTDCNVVAPNFFIPDGFSPNGDGVNDVFVIPNIDFLFPDYIIEIFNRYGNGMYRGGKDKPGWDGINYETKGISNGIAPNGVYFYVIHFNKDNKLPKQGRIYLNR
jgi:gliding motility-associated-like protein